MFFYLNEKITHNPYYNLAREEAIALNLVEFKLVGGLRFWKNPKSIILGLSNSISQNVPVKIFQAWEKSFSNLEYTKLENPNIFYIARRSSGGGAVYQDKLYNLNYSLFVNLTLKTELFPVETSYKVLLGIIQEAVLAQGISCKFAGKSDLCLEIDGHLLKISGNSQFRKKNCLVQHGTLILHPNLIQTISQTLLHPPEEPEYRKKRSHENFLTSLPNTFSVNKFQEDVKNFFLEYLEISPQGLPKEFWKKVCTQIPKLQATKFQNKDFILSKL